MTGFDFVVIGVVALSVLLGLMRGAVKEILSLAAWVLAFVAAKTFAATAAGVMPDFISNAALRYLAGFILVFIVVMALAMLLSLLLSESLKALGLGMVDRMLGGVFGFLRGMVIVTMLVLLAGLTQLPKTEVWRQASLSGVFEILAIMVKPWLPMDLANHIHYR
ncbi:colicin V biosynthesis protein [Sulfuriferula plumbiphila]|uniref:Colicin V biosynthesis protein n=1 Tax=Sulfuriferula plumbiphila TaxID=171865 RepID=A0A512L7C9_9PROT|nr:CvpA family protein [Sulfuriferula plumbiphila]BBP03650.1 colicin V biosynthesis protein [Sulfuriferula plumbiphila]GEP30051.1 colicin V biosynthesis protein [Sulfuriferula plumbiphila]